MESARRQREQTKSEPVRGWTQKVRAPVTTVASRPLSLNDSHSPALRLGHAFGMQAKLTVNEPGDRYEQEADCVAEQVLRMPDTTLRLQRKCGCGGSTPSGESCAECASQSMKLQRSATPEHSSSAATSPSVVHDVLRSSGQPLDQSTRAFFEPRFGHDFSRVRVHTDAKAAESARAINAAAYTMGNNLVFDQGRFLPETVVGKRLLGHELAHVLQQGNGAQQSVRRVTNADLRITGLAPDLAAVNNTIRFEFGSTAIPPVENWKITAQATPTSRDITLNGYASEEGTLFSRTALTNNRITAVSNDLAAAGHIGPKRPHPNPTGGEGTTDYRAMRIVEIVDTPIGAAPIPTAVHNCAAGLSTPCGTRYTSAFPVAQKKLSDARTALTAPSPATTAQVSTHFGATPAATLLTNIIALEIKLNALNGVHSDATDCRFDACNGTCLTGAAAYVDESVPQRMILCELFVNDPDQDNRADTLIHESLHVTPGVMTKDIAYSHTRRIRTLNDVEKLKNTDSYVNLIRVLHDPAAPITAPPTDTILGTGSPTEHDFAQRAIDFLEQWLISAKFTTGSLYDEINTALSSAAGAARWANSRHWFHGTMQDLHPLFGLTNPGILVPFTAPSRNDKIRVAGINDRYQRMREVLHSATVTLRKISAGTDAWANNLGNSVDVTAPFFLRSDVNAIKHLIRLMLKSMPDVPSSLVTNYVNGVNRIRIQNGVGP